jgi:hypothetical protein
MLNKLELTRQLSAQLPEDARPELDQALKSWWINLRETGGLRLTDVGYMAFDMLEIERHEYSLADYMPIKANVLITLDQKLTCPYYISPGKKSVLTMFGTKEAVMLRLYGDIDRYLTMLSNS